MGAASDDCGVNGSRGDGEHVAVPLQGGEALGEAGEHVQPPSGLGQLHLEPADLLEGRPVHRAAQNVGEQLAAQADAQHQLAGVDGAPDEALLGGQPGVGVVLVDVHGAAHDHQEVEALRSGQGARPGGLVVHAGSR